MDARLLGLGLGTRAAGGGRCAQGGLGAGRERPTRAGNSAELPLSASSVCPGGWGIRVGGVTRLGLEPSLAPQPPQGVPTRTCCRGQLSAPCAFQNRMFSTVYAQVHVIIVSRKLPPN